MLVRFTTATMGKAKLDFGTWLLKFCRLLLLSGKGAPIYHSCVCGMPMLETSQYERHTGHATGLPRRQQRKARLKIQAEAKDRLLIAYGTAISWSDDGEGVGVGL